MAWYHKALNWIDKNIITPITDLLTDGKASEVKNNAGINGNYGDSVAQAETQMKEATGAETTGEAIYETAKDKLQETLPEVSEIANNITQKIQDFTTPAANQEIQDTTDQNIIRNIGSQEEEGQGNISAYEQQRALLQEQWDREDAIRKETQEREDTAYQRAVTDMRKAGINPNLVGVSAASSGGGITNATGMNYTASEQELTQYLKELEIYLDQEFQANENQKDRITEIMGTIVNAIIWGKILKK